MISTAGYNICSELLAHAHRALLIPRVVHREEQLLRARRLEQLGLVRFLHPKQASPAAIAEQLREALSSPALPLDECRASQSVELNGASRMAEFVASLLPAPSPAS